MNVLAAPVDTGVLQWGVGTIVTLALGFTGLILERMRRQLIRATARKTNAEAESQEIQNIRQVMDEMRVERAEDRKEIEITRELVRQLEERERHGLVRSAVHEAWDKITHQLVLKHYPDHEPPPPLGSISALQASEQLFVKRLGDD